MLFECGRIEDSWGGVVKVVDRVSMLGVFRVREIMEEGW